MKRCVADWVKGNKPPGVTLMSQSCLDHSTPKPQSGPSVLTLGKHDEKVLAMHRDGLPYRLIGRNLGLSKNTVMKIIKRGSIVAAA
jgi:DNA-binding NarL/FixJ family response regulator